MSEMFNIFNLNVLLSGESIGELQTYENIIQLKANFPPLSSLTRDLYKYFKNRQLWKSAVSAQRALALILFVCPKT